MPAVPYSAPSGPSTRPEGPYPSVPFDGRMWYTDSSPPVAGSMRKIVPASSAPPRIVVPYSPPSAVRIRPVGVQPSVRENAWTTLAAAVAGSTRMTVP